MKILKSLFIVLLFAFLGCKTSQNKSTATLLKSSKWETLATENIKKEELKKGQMLCDRVLSTCNSSYFKAFNSQEATPELIQKMTPEKITATCKEIIKGYGSFKSTLFKEAQYFEKDGLTLYIFDCEYEKKYYKKVIKIMMNEKGQATNILTETIQ
ncbi:MAG: hypothetical protein ACOVLC_13010 [Flavobacterium sp.]